jgi:mono/diheme cytochrome c family protein
MHPTARGFLTGVATAVAVAAAAGYAYVGAGLYPIGADVPHAPLTLHLVERLRDAATERAATTVVAPKDLDDPSRIASGAREYAEECTGCHLAPGQSGSELRAGLYPQPPNLGKDGIDNDAEAFWIIKHGIKMSAMPAWGRTHSDAQMWSLVAFLRKVPNLSPEQYKALVGAAAPAGGDRD